MRVLFTNDYMINSFLLSALHKCALVEKVDLVKGERCQLVSYDYNDNLVITIHPLELRQVTIDGHYVFYGDAKYRPLTATEQQMFARNLKLLNKNEFQRK